MREDVSVWEFRAELKFSSRSHSKRAARERLLVGKKRLSPAPLFLTTLLLTHRDAVDVV